MNAARIAINNALVDPEIAASVAGFGYTPDKMLVGKQLPDVANRFQEAAKGDARQSTRKQKAALSDLHKWSLMSKTRE